MKLISRVTTMFLLAGFMLLPAYAQRLQKVASNRGQLDPTCTAGSLDLPCFTLTPFSPGSDTALFINFDFNGNLVADWNLFVVPTSVKSVTFQLPSVSAGVGSFLCNGASLTDFGKFCTDTVDPNALDTDFLGTPVVDSSTHRVTFSFLTGVPDLPAAWVFFADSSDKAFIVPGGSTSVPEPATFALLAGGLLALASIKRLRT